MEWCSFERVLKRVFISLSKIFTQYIQPPFPQKVKNPDPSATARLLTRLLPKGGEDCR